MEINLSIYDKYLSKKMALTYSGATVKCVEINNERIILKIYILFPKKK